MSEIRERIYHTAQQLFAERGYAGVSIADIAERAKIAKSTVLHHYGNKRKLYEQVVAESIEFFERVQGDKNDELTLEQKLLNLLLKLIEEPIHAKLLNRVFMDNPKTAAMAARRYWRPLLAQLAGGTETPRQASAMFCVNAIIQIAFSIELQREIFGRCDSRTLAEYYSGVVKSLFEKHTISAAPLAADAAI